jgi:hypothetical protein
MPEPWNLSKKVKLNFDLNFASISAAYRHRTLDEIALSLIPGFISP